MYVEKCDGKPVTKVINFSVLRYILCRAERFSIRAVNFYFPSHFISILKRRFLFYAEVTAKKK